MTRSIVPTQPGIALQRSRWRRPPGRLYTAGGTVRTVPGASAHDEGQGRERRARSRQPACQIRHRSGTAVGSTPGKPAICGRARTLGFRRQPGLRYVSCSKMASSRPDILLTLRRCWNWHTGQTQTLLPVRACGFESHPPYQTWLTPVSGACAVPRDVTGMCRRARARASVCVLTRALSRRRHALARPTKRVESADQPRRPYPQIVARGQRAIADGSPGVVSAPWHDPAVSRSRAYWKHWVCLFPQHGRGPQA